MEVEDGNKIFSEVLTNEEWSLVPSAIGKKLQAFVEEKFEELITSKALYETRKADTEQKIQSLESELNATKNEHSSTQHNLEVAEKTIAELESQLSLCTSELTTLQETCNRLEASTAEFRRQRDMEIDERENTAKMLERRNAEIERLQMDLNTLSAQLNGAVNSKCEALAKLEEISSLKITVEYKEKHMEQEKIFLNNQIKNLSEDLNKRICEVQNLRHEHTTSLIVLETKLTKKSEELKIANENMASLTVANKNLTLKAEELTEKLKQQRETEIKLQESFNNELLAQTKLAELYKGMSDENSSQIEELQKAVADLQNLVQNTTEQYGDLETKYKEAELEHEEILTKKNECIILLKSEVEKLQELLKSAREESLHREIENISPSAATIHRMIKPNSSLTQIYSQLVTISEELSAEKKENLKLNSYLSKIAQEIEDKTPILQKEREDYDHALETISELTKHNENMIAECHRLREEAYEAKKLESRAARENERMKKEVNDLSRQVCVLLKEVESSRADSDHDSTLPQQSLDDHTSADIITKKLVTFADIQELQSNNRKLLVLVRELSTKQEEAEGLDPAAVATMREKITTLRENQRQMLMSQEQQSRMLESVIRQRDMYRSLCAKGKGDEEGLPMDQSSSDSRTESETHLNKAPSDSEKDRKFKELEESLTAAQKSLQTLTDEYETYRKEKALNDKILLEQLESLKKEHRELTQMNCKLTALSEYTEERFKIMKQNAEVYKNQISALEEKNKTYNSTIIKHEQSLMHLKDETLTAQTKLSRAEVALQNLQQECRLLRDSEARLLKEKEILARETQGQNLLLNNLELIKASLDRSEAEGKMRLETRLDESLRESSALRRRLQEEQDKFRELSGHLERQAQNAQQKMEEEKSQADHFREELTKAREALVEKTKHLEQLSKKIKNSMNLSHSTDESNRCKELERQLTESRNEIEALQQELNLSKENILQYCNIAECAEKELKSLHEQHEQFKKSTEEQLKSNEILIANLNEKMGELEAELSLQSSGQAETTIELKNQLTAVQKQLKFTTEELQVCKHNLEVAQQEAMNLSEAARSAEDKYAKEMMLHSGDLQTLTTLKEVSARAMAELNEVKAERDRTVEALEALKTGFEEREKILNHDKEEMEKRLKTLDEQNSVLYDQIQALSTQLSLSASLNQSSSDISLNRSLCEDDLRSSEQLLQIVKFLRKEKDLAVTKFDVLQAENLRLKSQFEMLEKDLKETKEALAKEREGSEVSMVTATKHSEVLRKVETLNAITDSNKILRDERDTLKQQLNTLSQRTSVLEDQLAPLQEQNRELNLKIESMSSENQALRAEATRWRQRANILIEKVNKISPEDWRRLQSERENLAKLLTSEKDSHKRLTEEFTNLKQEKFKQDEQLNNLSLQNRNQSKELRRLNDELNGVKTQISRLSQELIEAREIAAQRTDENTKITEDLASKDVMLTDIRAKETQVRKIAKKYKTQYEELAKTMEEEKRKSEEKMQAGSSTEVPLDIQESLRDEGRRELRQKLASMEQMQQDRLSELQTQIDAAQQELDSLKSENSQLKNSETERDERTKLVLKAAKMRITDLTEERNKFKRELQELRTRCEGGESSKETSGARTEKDRNEERERFIREIETLNQRIAQLQRQALPGAAKPTTSSKDCEKTGAEPPTANIKPLPGHSNSSQQQSATVMPWRGTETPFASIRPMSQLRTVAVLPTSQTSSTSSSSTVLIPPQQHPQQQHEHPQHHHQQQQLVHTTGTSSLEVMSSSPTSSHTDYMPATSSASASGAVRQVAVPPTQQATVGMSSSREDVPSAAESTQDGEAETEPPQPAVQQQQAVAMVLPRVEQQTSGSQGTNPDQTTQSAQPSISSSQPPSSSNTVTTTQASTHKRPREPEDATCTAVPQPHHQPALQPHAKRSRILPAPKSSDCGVEVEYQVPTSSQRDQEDDVIVLSEDEGPDEGEGDGGDGEEEGMIMMEADDDAAFEEVADGDEMEAMAYELVSEERQMAYDDADCADLEPPSPVGDADDPNNEVEIIDDSSEVPNQSGSSSNLSIAPEQSGTSHPTDMPLTQTQPASQSEAISSGSGSESTFTRNRIAPLSRQQQQSQLVLPHSFEEGDDGIVPSTPTLYVPRSSPHVPNTRFTFGDAAPRTSSAQPTSEATTDDSRDLPQVDESGTGRSVPSTPLQVSPQGDQITTEANPEVGPSADAQLPEQHNQTQNEDIPSITVTQAGEEAETSNQQESINVPGVEDPTEEVAGTSGSGNSSTVHRTTSTPEGQDESEDLLEGEEGTDGVSSEGEKAQTIDESEIEEGREAEASESPSSNTRSRSGRGVATARRSSRIGFRNRTPHRPTPIVWNSAENMPGRQGPSPGMIQPDIIGARGRGQDLAQRSNFITRHRARRMRQLRAPFGRF